MKITQYQTTDNQNFVSHPVFPSVEMSGALTLAKGDHPLSNSFEGFGVAITGSSCYELSLMTPEQRESFLRDIYTKDGIGLSVGRLSVGASDYSAELYSYDDVEGDMELKHFSIDRDRAYIIPMLQEILRINPDLYLYASPWSPPGWMKTGGNLCGGYMREEYLDCYANYIVRFLQEYAKCGVKISALTPQNECEQQQHGMMPACAWHPDLEAKFISILRKKLKENNLDVKIWMYDYNFDGVSRVQWMLKQHPALLADCDGIAFHYYRGAIEDTLCLKEQFPDMALHFTEGGPRLYDHYDCDWCKWGIMMSKTLNCGYGSLTGWNLMLDENGGPNIGPYFCGGLVTRNSQSGELSYSGQYKTFRHIARFMEKGAEVYPVSINHNVPAMFGFPKSATPIVATSFRNPDGKLVYVVTNQDTTKRQIQFYEGGTWWYAELLPNSLSTIVVEA